LKKIISLIVIVTLIAIFMSLREHPKGEPVMEGYIVEAGFMYQLVANGISKEEAKAYSKEDLLDLEGVSAVRFYKYNFFQFREGQKVKVWSDSGMEDSFPGKANADYMKVIEEK